MGATINKAHLHDNKHRQMVGLQQGETTEIPCFSCTLEQAKETTKLYYIKSQNLSKAIKKVKKKDIPSNNFRARSNEARLAVGITMLGLECQPFI